MPYSRLYRGFRLAGALSSVKAQREYQKLVLASLPGSRLLIVGCGFGDEAEQLLSDKSCIQKWSDITAIDLADVSGELRRHEHLSMLTDKLRFHQCDLLEACCLDSYGFFDIVQCSFVLHDIRPSEKGTAMERLAAAVRYGGHIIISDIFPLRGLKNQNARDVYDTFIYEALDALAVGRISSVELNELLGDGTCSGLLRSREEAIQGTRDFFESTYEIVGRAFSAGLSLISLARNIDNENLAVLVFVRQESISDRMASSMGTIDGI